MDRPHFAYPLAAAKSPHKLPALVANWPGGAIGQRALPHAATVKTAPHSPSAAIGPMALALLRPAVCPSFDLDQVARAISAALPGCGLSLQSRLQVQGAAAPTPPEQHPRRGRDPFGGITLGFWESANRDLLAGRAPFLALSPGQSRADAASREEGAEMPKSKLNCAASSLSRCASSSCTSKSPFRVRGRNARMVSLVARTLPLADTLIKGSAFNYALKIGP
jgi:hypothetical protein